MERKEFRDLLAECTKTTQNIRAFNDWRYSGVYQVPDEITARFGRVVALLQSEVDKGHFCKENEYLMLYNFQPLHITDEVYLCTLDMVIKPLKEINELGNNNGKPFQLVVNGTTGEIGNNAYGLAIIMGEEADDEAEIEGEEPVVYGNYNDVRYSKPSPELKAVEEERPLYVHYNNEVRPESSSQDFVNQLSQLQMAIEAVCNEIEPNKRAENRPAMRFSVQPNVQAANGFNRQAAMSPFEGSPLQQEPWIESTVKASPPTLIRQLVA